MCGIAGIFGKNLENKVLNHTILENMANSMLHRGPDAGGIWLSAKDSIGLCHRRLSIVDLSAAAAQPMSVHNELVWVVFNGEIYNHLELRKQLIELSCKFITDHSDTEVLLHGYLAWGLSGLLARIEGMFAFALYDRRTQDVFLVRDRMGIKPLYYSIAKGVLLFASEIKALLLHPLLVDRDIDPTAMYHYLSFMATPSPLTMFKGIYKLQQGSWLRFNASGAVVKQCWWMSIPRKSSGSRQEVTKLSIAAQTDYYKREIRTKLETAVSKMMLADVPVGVFLSGGVDSSTLLALMSRLSTKPINCFSVGFAEHPQLNEVEYAQKTAQQFGANYAQVLIKDADISGYLGDLIYHQDEPIADWVCIPLHFVSKLAHEHDVKVVQIGEGADEQFCGYGYYLHMLNLYNIFWRHYKHLPQRLRVLVAKIATLLPKWRYGLVAYADMLQRAATNGEVFWTGAPVFWETEKQILCKGLLTEFNNSITSDKYTENMASSSAGLMRDNGGALTPLITGLDSAQFIAKYMGEIDSVCPNQDQLTRMIYAEFQLRLPELLLMRVDKITMANSIEARVPFLDTELVNLTFDIPQGLKIPGNKPKAILKEAVRGLIPDVIINRPKQGFGAPMDKWLIGGLGKQVAAEILSSKLMHRGWFDKDFIEKLVIEHRTGRRNHAIRIWNLFNLAAWYNRWIEK